MNLDTRARRAAQGIHRAVEVMEMAKSTKEPTLVEPFERYVETKQRNRRRGAILVAGAMVIALLVIVAVSTLDGPSTDPVPAAPGGGESTIGSTSVAGGTVTMTAVGGCSIETPGTIEAFGATTSSGLLSFAVQNRSSDAAWFDVARIDTSVMTFDEFLEETARAEARVDRGGAPGAPPAGMTIMGSTRIVPNGSGTLEVLASAGTYGVVCLKDVGGGDLAPDTALGPIVLT